MAVALYRDHDLGHARQRGGSVLGLVFLQEAEQCIQQHHGSDDDGIHRPADKIFQSPDHDRDGDGGQQQVDQRILELAQEAAPAGYWRLAVEKVRAMLLQPFSHLRAVQSALRVALPLRQQP